MNESELPRFAELDAEYEILRELGRGGTAVVYLARERELERNVAIKVIRSTYIEDEEAAARLMREARTVGGLQHPNIVMLYGTRRLRDNSLALIMQYVAGRTLRSELDDVGALPFGRVHGILRDVGNALECAHRHRIVHRDIKPENIYLDESGTARLSDFGIARSWDGNANLTMPGTAIGTPAYMSPEQIDGEPLDGRSDIYSLGLVGYEMLTGVAPWQGETLYSVIYRQKHAELESIVELRPDTPRALLHAVDGALHKHRDARWADPAAFLAALDGARAGGRRTAVAKHATPAKRATPAKHATPRTDTTGSRTATPGSRKPAAPADGATIRFRRDEGTKPVQWAFDEPAAASDRARPEPGPLVTAAAPPKPRRRRLIAAIIGLIALAGTTGVVLTQWPPGGLALAGATNGTSTASSDFTPTSALPAGPASMGTESTPPDANDPNATPLDALAFDSTMRATDRTGTGSIAARIAQLLGDQQQGLAGDTLPERLLLQVTDSAGDPVAGTLVRFAVTAGGGAVFPSVTETDEYGVAAARWILRDTGMQTVTAEIDALDDEPVTFHATALPRAPARMRASGAADVRAAAGSSTEIAVVVQDDRGHPVADVPVRFRVESGDGSFADAEVATDDDGTAEAQWQLGSATEQEAVASIASLPNATVRFHAAVRMAPLTIRSALTVGGTHTCWLGSDGAASCWGGNDNGQLGDGSSSRRAAPVVVAAREPLAMLSAGVAHTCALGRTGSVFCWGSNTAGQLGTGDRTARSTPTSASTGVPMVSVAAGMAHTCALDAAGNAYCWGQNTHGQLGDGTRTDRTAPVRVAGDRRFRSIAVGWAHTCALAMDRSAYCWGRNTSGELGSSGGDHARPTAVHGGSTYSSIAAGSSHTCGLRTDGAILCWGQNTHGQLGSGNTENSSTPVAVESLTPFGAVSVGGVHTCALTRDGNAYCWGRNTYGQLGSGSTDDAARPTAVEGGLRFNALYASGAHTCGSTRDGARYCWGFNLEGQLGDGTRTNRARPVAVARR